MTLLPKVMVVDEKTCRNAVKKLDKLRRELSLGGVQLEEVLYTRKLLFAVIKQLKEPKI